MELSENISIRLFQGEKCFGPGMAELLEGVKEHHSLRAAAMSMQVAYSKAWTMIRRAEDAMGFSLLHSVTGGRGGGGAVLTDRAELLLRQHRRYQKDVGEYAHRQFLIYFADFLPPADE